MKITYARLQELREQLHHNVMWVNFNKVSNGEEREMYCTLHESYLPDKNLQGHGRRPNPDVINVWDVDENDWRSFNVHTINDFSISFNVHTFNVHTINDFSIAKPKDDVEEEECDDDDPDNQAELVNDFADFKDTLESLIQKYDDADNADDIEDRDDTVKELLNAFGKMQVIVHEWLTSEL